MIRWPGVIKPGTVDNDIISQIDWMPTLVAAAGEPNIKEKLMKGYAAGGKTWKIHPDGYNFLPYFKGEVHKGPRDTIYYFSQGGELNAVRWNYNDYPNQPGSSLNAAGINYNSLRAMEALKRLQQMEEMTPNR